jgi:Holliday junction resolvase-like predicted endonuclease
MATKVTTKRAIAPAEREEDVLANIRAIKLETAQIEREIVQLKKAAVAEAAANDERRKHEAAANKERREKEFAKLKKEREKIDKELKQIMKDLAKQVGGATNSNGDAAEEYSINALEAKMTFAGVHYDSFNANMLSYVKELNIREEYDIVLLNGSSVAIIEVKYNAKDADFLSTLTDRKVKNFRLLFPQYAKHKIYLGIAAMSFDDKVVAAAKKLGVGILRQVGGVLESDTENIITY